MNEHNQAVATAPSDAELILRAKNGEESAFEAIYNAYKRRIYRICLRMIGNAAEAEELMQEAFLQLFRKINTFRGEAAFSTWLHRVTLNVVLMRLRKRKLNGVPLESPNDTDKEEHLERQYGTVDLALDGLVDRLTLDAAVAELPQGYKRVFELHDVFGYEHNEIARMLGCSVGNSKSQLHKARTKLRKFLGSRCRPDAPAENSNSLTELAVCVESEV